MSLWPYNPCERAECGEPGHTYQSCGGTVMVGGGFNTSSGGPQLEQPITLCQHHAVEAFGWGMA